MVSKSLRLAHNRALPQPLTFFVLCMATPILPKIQYLEQRHSTRVIDDGHISVSTVSTALLNSQANVGVQNNVRYAKASGAAVAFHHLTPSKTAK